MGPPVRLRAHPPRRTYRSGREFIHNLSGFFDHSHDFEGDVVHQAMAINLAKFLAVAVVLDERSRLLSIDVDPRADHLFRIIDTWSERTPAVVARLDVAVVLGVRPALTTDHPSSQTAQDFRFGEHDFEHDQRAARLHESIERLSLGHGPRKPVKQESWRGVGLFQSFEDDSRDEVVVDESSALEDGLHLSAE